MRPSAASRLRRAAWASVGAGVAHSPTPERAVSKVDSALKACFPELLIVEGVSVVFHPRTNTLTTSDEVHVRVAVKASPP